MEFILQEFAVCPHDTGEGVIFAIIEWNCDGTLAMRSKPETDGIAINFNPDMTSRITCTPFEENHRIVLVKTAPTFECVFVECLEHFSKAAFLQDTLRILTHSQAPCFICFA